MDIMKRLMTFVAIYFDSDPTKQTPSERKISSNLTNSDNAIYNE